MAVSRRLNVAPPARIPTQYGLLSVVTEYRPTATETLEDGTPVREFHWRAGVTWQDICGGGAVTYDLCVAQSNNLTVTGAPPKAATNTIALYGATSFDAFVELDCSAVGFWDNPERTPAQRAEAALVENEPFQVEKAFWTGKVGPEFVVFPHLAATAVVLDSTPGPSVTLQMAATQLNSGTPMDPVEALGSLESAMANCLNTVGVIHVPAALMPHLVKDYLIYKDGARYKTWNGNLVAVGYGYPGTSPAGFATANAQWMYGTGPVFAYKGEIKVLGRPVEQFDRAVDTVKAIVERPWLLGFDCCLFAVAVSTGGTIAGTGGAAT